MFLEINHRFKANKMCKTRLKACETSLQIKTDVVPEVLQVGVEALILQQLTPD